MLDLNDEPLAQEALRAVQECNLAALLDACAAVGYTEILVEAGSVTAYWPGKWNHVRGPEDGGGWPMLWVIIRATHYDRRAGGHHQRAIDPRALPLGRFSCVRDASASSGG